jgi:hypothetical protein
VPYGNKVVHRHPDAAVATIWRAGWKGKKKNKRKTNRERGREKVEGKKREWEGKMCVCKKRSQKGKEQEKKNEK